MTTSPAGPGRDYREVDPTAEVEVLVDETWWPGDLDAWQNRPQASPPGWWGHVRYHRPEGNYQSWFHHAQIRRDTVDRSHGRQSGR